MPPKRDFDCIFLALFMESLEDEDNVNEFKLQILMTHADTLRGNLERMETDWDRLRDRIAQRDEF
jgi:hypothetical protein